MLTTEKMWAIRNAHEKKYGQYCDNGDFEMVAHEIAEAAVQDVMKSVKPEEFHGWYCAHCQHGVDASDVTFHEQHTVCGRMIANDVPPRPQASAAVPDVPQGAIHNGRAFADRLESEYKFECEAGPLHLCSDWQELRRCFEHLADWASMLAASQPEVRNAD